jgi:toxin ParE1/3/4
VSLPLEFHPAVRDEIDDAHDWYEQRQAGLGSDFLDEVQRVLAEITANPARYGFADANVREGLLSRFRYAVYYRVLTDRIRVLAV